MVPLSLMYTGFTDGGDVTQSSIMWEDKGDNAAIHCSHTKGAFYYQICWCRQLPREAMKPIVFTIVGS